MPLTCFVFLKIVTGALILSSFLLVDFVIAAGFDCFTMLFSVCFFSLLRTIWCVAGISNLPSSNLKKIVEILIRWLPGCWKKNKYEFTGKYLVSAHSVHPLNWIILYRYSFTEIYAVSQISCMSHYFFYFCRQRQQGGGIRGGGRFIEG